MVENTSRLSTVPECQRPPSSSGISFMRGFLARRGLLRCRRERARDPRIQIGERARTQSALLGSVSRAEARADLFFTARRRFMAQRREQPEIDIHGLKRARPRVDRLDMAAGDVSQKRAV